MDPALRLKLQRQLEALKDIERKNMPGWFTIPAYWGEVLMGLYLLGRAIIPGSVQIPRIAHWSIYAVSTALIFHGLYLLIRYRFDRRMRTLLEALLSTE